MLALSYTECQADSNAAFLGRATHSADALECGGRGRPGRVVLQTGGVRREFSAGGVVVRRLRGRWVFAAIRPAGKPPGVWALPKGLVGAREPVETAALREAEEETGVRASLVEKLGDARYVYTWAGERVFKIVTFYLLRYRGGRLGDLAPEQAREVAEARWLELAVGPRLLAYKGEREMVEKAAAALDSVETKPL